MEETKREAMIASLKDKIKHHSDIVKEYKAELKRLEKNEAPSIPDHDNGNKPPIPKIIY